MIRNMLNSNTSAGSDEKKEKRQDKGVVCNNEEVELLKLKYEKLQYIDEKERNGIRP